MSNARQLDRVWLNGRETDPGSHVNGEVVVPLISAFEQPGSLPRCGEIIGRLPHATTAHVASTIRDSENQQIYHQISTDTMSGWVSDNCIADKWSSFTFIGTLDPVGACSRLDTRLDFHGMSMVIRQEGFAIATEGTPQHFDSMQYAATRFADRVANALAPVTTISVRARIANWVEVPIDGKGTGPTVGFSALRRDHQKTVGNDHVESVHALLPLMSLIPYLDLAVSDFHQALEYPQHALIFLARAIESIENHFAGLAKGKKGAGKEKVMRRLLGVSRRDVEFVTKMANKSHRRHASQDGRARLLTSDELAECFHKTASIIEALVGFLRDAGLGDYP